METLQTIKTRRSIRDYTDLPVSDEAIQTILEAAMQAPSAHNEQPRHFVVIKDKDLLKHISENHQYTDMVAHCPVAILVCATEDLDYRTQDCSIASENILLAAHDLGLGAVYVTLYPNAKNIDITKRLLNIPDYIMLLCIIPIGYPAEYLEPENRFDEKKIHHNTR
jgi:nitroreductase